MLLLHCNATRVTYVFIFISLNLTQILPPAQITPRHSSFDPVWVKSTWPAKNCMSAFTWWSCSSHLIYYILRLFLLPLQLCLVHPPFCWFSVAPSACIFACIVGVLLGFVFAYSFYLVSCFSSSCLPLHSSGFTWWLGFETFLIYPWSSSWDESNRIICWCFVLFSLDGGGLGLDLNLDLVMHNSLCTGWLRWMKWCLLVAWLGLV